MSKLHTLDFERLVDYYNQGHSMKECARKFGMSYYEVDSTLWRYAESYGYVRRISEQRSRCGLRYCTKGGKWISP